MPRRLIGGWGGRGAVRTGGVAARLSTQRAYSRRYLAPNKSAPSPRRMHRSRSLPDYKLPLITDERHLLQAE